MTSTHAILAAVSVALFILGVVLWLKQEQQRGWAAPAFAVPAKAYRLLERVRDQLLQGSREVRLTIFRPDPDEPHFLRPIARIGWGRSSSLSVARFKRGEGLAGMAAEPGCRDGILVARIGPLGHPEKAREAHRRLFRLNSEAAESLSDGQLRTTVLIATALMQGRIFKGVLCVDSLDPALVPLDMESPFWARLDRCAAELARVLPAPQPHVSHEEIETFDGAELEKVCVSSAEFHSPQPNIPGMRPGSGELVASGT